MAGRERRAVDGNQILDAGAVPVMLGGDDSVPIPFIAAFAKQPAIVILQIFRNLCAVASFLKSQ